MLFVGRLIPAKGLHLLLGALPALRAQFPELRVMLVTGPGEKDYEEAIQALIRQSALDSILTVHESLDRERLHQVYREHDALFFHSANPEPVALVLMEAFAARLPVAASMPQTPSRLVCADETCLCYDPSESSSIVTTIARLFTDRELRTCLTQNARQLIEAEFTLDAMGEAYDALLRAYVEQDVPRECA